MDVKFNVTHTDCFCVDVEINVTHTDCSKVCDLKTARKRKRFLECLPPEEESEDSDEDTPLAQGKRKVARV